MTASWRVNGGEILKYPQGFWCDESHISILSTAFSAKRRKPIGSYKPTGYSAIKGLREYVTSNDLFTAKSILKYMPVRISDKAEAMTISSCSNAMHRPRSRLDEQCYSDEGPQCYMSTYHSIECGERATNNTFLTFTSSQPYVQECYALLILQEQHENGGRI